MTGAGFRSGEIVTMRVVRADGAPSPGADHLPWTVAANRAGRFATTWLVCGDDCAGETLLATARGASSGSAAQTTFLGIDACEGGAVASVSPVAGGCASFTPAAGGGPDNFEVQQGGTYSMTIIGASECSGDTITVFVQNGSSGNFCFVASGGNGTYVGRFTMPNPACGAFPVRYKCGADAPCSRRDSFSLAGPTSCRGVHLRAANFDVGCVEAGEDTDCSSTAPLGACCLADGTCVEVSATDCAAMSGLYHGDSSLCASANCPQPPGACCFADGSCVEVTEDDCVALGGTYNGDSTRCMAVVCEPPTGACCLLDGSCVEVQEEDCAALDGTYLDDSTLCADVGCPQPAGACCLVDTSCVQVTEDDCLSLGGLYNGDDSLCAEVDCEGSGPICYTLTFITDDVGNPVPHGAHVDSEFDGVGLDFPVAITGSVNPAGQNTAAILNSTTGPAVQDPDLMVGKGNILILQTDSYRIECPPGSGIYCAPNDDPDGGTLSFVFAVPTTPSSIALIDVGPPDPATSAFVIDSDDIEVPDSTSTVVLTDANGRTRTYTIPANWTGDRVMDGPPGWRVLDLTTLAGQPGVGSIARASQQAGYTQDRVLRIDVHLAGSGGIDDVSWCQ